MPRRAEAVAGGIQGAAAVASVVVEFDIEAVGECLPFGMSHMMQEEAGLGRLVAVVLYFALQAPLACLARGPISGKLPMNRFCSLYSG